MHVLYKIGIFNFMFFFLNAVFDYSIGETMLTVFSIFANVSFLRGWYIKVNHITRFFNTHIMRLYLNTLPLITVFLYLVTLRNMASYDVVDALPYILMYLLFGIAWLHWTFQWMFWLWSFSYQDDVLMGRNCAALIAFSGAFLGVSLIYAGANIGDGPGWWTVVWAGGLGTVTWLVLGMFIKKYTIIMDSVLMDKDTDSGIRLGSFLLAGGLILARASSGDWTSFLITATEFLVGWPVIPLVMIMIAVERSLFRVRHDFWEEESNTRVKTILVSFCYIIYAVAAVAFVPAVF